MPAGPASPRRYKGRTAAQRTEVMAAWILDKSTENRRLGYVELRDLVMKEFDCGHAGAEGAIRVAREILHQRANDPSLHDRIADAYWDLYQDALANKDRGEARRTLDSLRTMFGVGAPKRVEHSGSIGLDLEKLSDEELAEAADLPLKILDRASSLAVEALSRKPNGSGN